MMDHGACVPLRVHTVVVSVQHSDKIQLDELRKIIMESVIKEVIPAQYLDEKTVFHINPCGEFIIGGPQVWIDSNESFIRDWKNLILIIWIFLERRWSYREENHCRYLWWLGGSWRRSVFRKRFHESR